LVDYRQTWGEHQVYFHDANQRLRAVPTDWTSMAALDPFVSVAAGRSCFRIVDLLELAQMIARGKNWSVKGIMPQV
jgi:hypothetical protein